VQHSEETKLPDLGGHSQIRSKGINRSLVSFEKQTILAAKVLENRALCYTQSGGNIPDSGRVIALLGKMTHGRIDNLRSLIFGARPWRQVSISRGRDQAAADSAHG
jgi:hypothetical protein